MRDPCGCRPPTRFCSPVHMVDWQFDLSDAETRELESKGRPVCAWCSCTLHSGYHNDGCPCREIWDRKVHDRGDVAAGRWWEGLPPGRRRFELDGYDKALPDVRVISVERDDVFGRDVVMLGLGIYGARISLKAARELSKALAELAGDEESK